MRINITAGDYLNKKLQNIYPNETFIPFREAMIKGTYSKKIFSDEFIEERSKVHEESKEKYLEKISIFIDVLNNLDIYTEIVLWFGIEDFCIENSKVVIQALKDYKYNNKLILHSVDELTCTVINTMIINKGI